MASASNLSTPTASKVSAEAKLTENSEAAMTASSLVLPSSPAVPLDRYERLLTHEVQIGTLKMGGTNPIRIQSMTTAAVSDIDGLVAETEELVAAGAELVRLTVPSLKAVDSVERVKAALENRGIRVPLVADVHFTPNVALKIAPVVEKVRINPGNYVDKKRFAEVELSEAEYARELTRLEDRFLPLLECCKKYGTAMRIGVNHGSLSDRIVTRYGDSPMGMVHSATEFLDVAERYGFDRIVISMKSSNPVTMVHAYRLMVAEMRARKMIYPLHLGVTEAGDGKLGRAKSAAGMATLLSDGIGDTIRVSLTEPSARELAVCTKLRTVQEELAGSGASFAGPVAASSFYEYKKRESACVHHVGHTETFRVFVSPSLPFGIATPKDSSADEAVTSQSKSKPESPSQSQSTLTPPTLSTSQAPSASEASMESSPSDERVLSEAGRDALVDLGWLHRRDIDKWETRGETGDWAIDGIISTPVTEWTLLPPAMDRIVSEISFRAAHESKTLSPQDATSVKLFSQSEMPSLCYKSFKQFSETVKPEAGEAFFQAEKFVHYVVTKTKDIPLVKEFLARAGADIFRSVIFLVEGTHPHAGMDVRALIAGLDGLLQPVGVHAPMVLTLDGNHLRAACANSHDQNDGASSEWLTVRMAYASAGLLLDGWVDGLYIRGGSREQVETAFALLQATRRRISQVDYISCPSCGRTLFDLQEVTARIKARTGHLHGVKIGIMGCIVNGPGEMADADFGYVGSGVDQITLYKGQTIMRRGIPQAEAVEALVDLIREHGQWRDPPPQ